MDENTLKTTTSLALLGFVVGLTPFLAVMTTSFVKLAIVFSLLRNALGIQQIPPNMALYGLAVILTVYIMTPVAYDMWQVTVDKDVQLNDATNIIDNIDAIAKPYLDFLRKFTSKPDRDFFVKTAKVLWPQEQLGVFDHDSVMIIVPAFTVTQLTEAFQIGFLIYLPFIIIDLVVSNILLAMGMMMVSPMTISLPFKLLLFVLADGWVRLVHGLVLTYV